MPKTNITSLVTMVSSLILLSAAGLANGLYNQALAQDSPWNSSQPSGAQPATPTSKQEPLAQTKKLEQNDNLDPTVNRTQAMRTEAATGTIAPITGSQKVTPTARPRIKTTPKSTKGKRIWHEY